MILKIRDPSEKRKWWFFDEVSRITVDRSGYQITEKEGKIVSANIKANSTGDFVDVDLVLAASAGIPLTLVSFRPERSSNEEGMSIVFKMGSGYLLNDEGKTVERL